MSSVILKLDSLELEPGMELAESIFTEEGVLALREGTVLDNGVISRLIFYNVKNIAIKEIPTEMSPSVDPSKLNLFKSIYEEKIRLTEHRLHQIKQGGQINREQLYNISKDITRTLEEPKDIFKYLRALKLSATSLYVHSINVALICNLFAIWFRFPQELRKDLAIAGLLHDIGKIVLGPEKLNNPKDYKKHSQLGCSLLVAHRASKAIQMGVLMHHEKEDGSGFPTGSKWGTIHPFAKIISIANYYDHVTTGGKVFQEKICPFNVIRVVEQNRYGKFDIRFMDIFLKKIADYYLGEPVRLTDGRVGKIVFFNKHSLSTPIIQVREELIDLYWETGLAVKELVE